MRFLVTGATGFVGSHLAELLVLRGEEVVCPVRNTDKLRYLKNIPVKVVDFNLLEPFLKHDGSFDYVIHLAAATRGLHYHDYWKANVDQTRRLLELFASEAQGKCLKRFVLVSSQAAAGPSSHDGRPVVETDPPNPLSSYGESKLEAERLTLSYSKILPITVVRPPTVFGPRDGDVLGVFKCAQWGFVPYIAGPDRLVSLIYVEDLVEGILTAAQNPIAEGKTYFIAYSSPVVWREFVLQIAKEMRPKVLAIPVPVHLIKLVALAGDGISRMRGSPTLFRLEKFQEMKQIAWVCSSERARNDLHWTAATPLPQAIRKTANWYRENGWL
jgi:nucleoside-diphosphate-sugar epimerase